MAKAAVTHYIDKNKIKRFYIVTDALWSLCI